MAWFRDYDDLGILGMNSRNSDYIARYNPRQNFPLVDDKILTKELAEAAHIPTPPVYDVIELPSQTVDFAERMQAYPEFVVKPAKGSGGGGIIVIKGHAPNGFRRASGKLITFEDMRYHLTNILSGLYSLGGQADKAIVQYRVVPSAFFAELTTSGVPDIRVIVFQGVPVMAMLRLPTRESDGKANLHAGGIGVGISIARGMTTHGVYRGGPIDLHPDTDAPVTGRVIPFWDEILRMSAQFCELTGLGYLGVDIVIDAERGPMMLEVNARPGIAIQVANQAGLKSRLQLVERKVTDLTMLQEKIEFAKFSF